MKSRVVSIGEPFRSDPVQGSRWLFAGPSGCGKTTSALFAIKKDWFGEFDEKVLISPSYAAQSMYDAVEWTRVVPAYDDNEIAEVLYRAQRRTERGLNKNTLVMVDDLLGEQGLRDPSSALVALYTRGRHIGVSTIVLIQHLNSLLPVIRTNSSLVFFESRNKLEQDAAYQVCGLGSRAEFYELLAKIWRQKHRPLCWRYTDNTHYAGYDRELLASDRREVSPTASSAQKVAIPETVAENSNDGDNIDIPELKDQTSQAQADQKPAQAETVAQ